MKTRQDFGWILSIGGILGFIAMTWQASERIAMLKNPGQALNCNLNPVIDCGTVLSNKLAAIFGFPNAFIGMIVFAMLAMAGFALLSGVKFTNKYKKIVFSLSLILILFSMWFFAASLYAIGKICIFCSVGWVVSIPIFIYSLIDLLESQKGKSVRIYYEWLSSNKLNIMIIWYLLMIMMFLFRFRDYYFG
jgi:uncharacterized membrane protein